MEPESYTLTCKHNLVRTGPAAFYDPVAAFPAGLPKGASVGICETHGNWGRLIGTTWWINLRFAKR